MASLHESTWRRAAADTRNVIFTLRFWLFELFAGSGLTIWVLIWQPPWASRGVEMVLYQVLVPLGGVLTGIALLLLVSVVIAPYRQRNELRVQLAGRLGIDHVLNELGQLRAEGVSLRNEARHDIEDEQQLQTWKGIEVSWLNRLVQKVRQLSPVDASFIETINEFKTTEKHSSIGDLTLQRSLIQERLKRLEAFMSRYQQ